MRYFSLFWVVLSCFMFHDAYSFELSQFRVLYESPQYINTELQIISSSLEENLEKMHFKVFTTYHGKDISCITEVIRHKSFIFLLVNTPVVESQPDQIIYKIESFEGHSQHKYKTFSISLSEQTIATVVNPPTRLTDQIMPPPQLLIASPKKTTSLQEDNKETFNNTPTSINKNENSIKTTHPPTGNSQEKVEKNLQAYIQGKKSEKKAAREAYKVQKEALLAEKKKNKKNTHTNNLDLPQKLDTHQAIETESSSIILNNNKTPLEKPTQQLIEEQAETIQKVQILQDMLEKRENKIPPQVKTEQPTGTIESREQVQAAPPKYHRLPASSMIMVPDDTPTTNMKNTPVYYMIPAIPPPPTPLPPPQKKNLSIQIVPQKIDILSEEYLSEEDILALTEEDIFALTPKR